MSRAAACAVLLALALSGCSASQSSSADGPAPAPSSSAASPRSGDADDGPYQPTDDDRAAIRELLKTRAAALQDGDREAFLATVDTEDPDLVRQQRTLFANLQQLPVRSVRYTVQDRSGLPTAKVAGDDPVFRPTVLEQVRLDVDVAPVTNSLEDTFVRRADGWLLGAESTPGTYRTEHEPQSRPWAGPTPVVVVRSGALTMVIDADRRPEAQGLVDQLAEDIRFDADALEMAPAYDVLVDATTVGQAHAMSTVGDTDAAAVTFGVLRFDGRGHGRFAGVRIKVNPETAARTIADPRVMRHELTHFLTLRRLAASPTWLKEGLAEWVSTAPAGLDDLVVPEAAYDHVTEVRHRLPTAGLWGLDPGADYLIGRAAVTHLVDTYGVAEVFALDRAYRTIDGDDADVKTDRVLRQVLRISEADLVAATWDDLATLHRS